jgi:hypothetical protein
VTKLAYAAVLVLAGCFDPPASMRVVNAPRLLEGSTSRLQVPFVCPIYTPTGRDIDTPERPFTSPVLFGCGVDSYGASYGLATGDIGDLAVLGGDREIGVFYAFDRTASYYDLTVDSLLGRDGQLPQVRAWAAPVNIADPFDPVPELPGDDGISRQRAVTVVALGTGGVLLSLGPFDGQPLQVAVQLNWSRNDPFGDYTERFYVNGPPAVLHGLPNYK